MSDADGNEAIERLLNDGWNYHDKESERLAGELEAAVGDQLAPRLLPAFLHLAVHTIGEHLGDWPRASAVGKQALESLTPTPESARAWARLHVAQLLAGEPLDAASSEILYLTQESDEFGPAWLDMRFMLVDALIGSARLNEAASIYRLALNLTDRLEPSASLDRTIAAASNNLAWQLYEMPSRTVEEDGFMQLSAETSLKFWLRCGNWINAERGEYLNAVVANAVGEPRSGLAHADKGLEIISANGERPLDSALLHLARAAALGLLGEQAGRTAAIAEADEAAAGLAIEALKAQFAAERAKVTEG